jgi:NAD(P)H-hydrate epimerase
MRGTGMSRESSGGMMKVATAEEMRTIDRETINNYGITGVVLMERAGLAVTNKIKELVDRGKVIIVSGRGNNGGDGFVVARNLHNDGWKVQVFLAARPEDLKGDALVQYKTAVKFGVEIKPVQDLLKQSPLILTGHSIVVDALLGTGLSKDVTGGLADIIDTINASGRPVFSVDIPSGISSDNGQIMGKAIRATYTVTFGLPKRGHLVHPGAQYSGKLFVEDIGFPKSLLCSEELNVELLEKKNVYSVIPERRRYSHKGTYGHVLIVAGSKGKTGAALMAAKACLRAGAGLVTLGVPESLADVFQSRVTEEMTLLLPSKGDGTLSQKASRIILDFLKGTAHLLAIGPGIGVSSETELIMKDLIRNSPSPVVIDADGINSLKGEKGIFSKAHVPVILTPHPGEMARILQGRRSKGTKKVSYIKTSDAGIRRSIEENSITTAISFARDTKTHLVLKGVPTIIATPDGKAYINVTGNPGMATGGTGDVLTGMIGGFLSQIMNPLNSCILGVFMHGLAGDIAASEKGMHPLIATDIIQNIPGAFSVLIDDGKTDLS